MHSCNNGKGVRFSGVLRANYTTIMVKTLKNGGQSLFTRDIGQNNGGGGKPHHLSKYLTYKVSENQETNRPYGAMPLVSISISRLHSPICALGCGAGGFSSTYLLPLSRLPQAGHTTSIKRGRVIANTLGAERFLTFPSALLYQTIIPTIPMRLNNGS